MLNCHDDLGQFKRTLGLVNLRSAQIEASRGPVDYTYEDGILFNDTQKQVVQDLMDHLDRVRQLENVQRRKLMAKMSHAGKDHGDTGLVGGCDDLFVTDRPTRLHHGGGPGFNGFK